MATDADNNPTIVEDGGDVNMVPMSADKVTTKTASKKTTNRVHEGVKVSASGSGEESVDQCILPGKAGKKILTTLPLTTCITKTRPEYAKYFQSLGVGKQRELCVLSKSIKI